jgi:hypothetical protein
MVGGKPDDDKAPTPATIKSGHTVYLRSHTGKLIDADDGALGCGTTDDRDKQALIIEKDGCGAIRHGDTIYLRTHEDRHVDVSTEDVVRARWHMMGYSQKLVIEMADARNGKPYINRDDPIHLRAHTGNYIDVQHTTVKARWKLKADEGTWQRFVIERNDEADPKATTASGAEGAAATPASASRKDSGRLASFFDCCVDRGKEKVNDKGDAPRFPAANSSDNPSAMDATPRDSCCVAAAEDNKSSK